MHPGTLSKSNTDGYYTIHSIIKTLSHLHRVIPLQNAYQETDQGTEEEGISEVLMMSKSIGRSGGTGLERAKSAPSWNHPDPVNRIFKIQVALGRLKCHLKHMKRLQLDVKTELNIQLHSLLLVVKDAERPRTLHASFIEKELDDINKKLLDLMSKVSVLPERGKKKKPSPNYQHDSVSNQDRDFLYSPSIHGDEENLKRHSCFRDVKDKYEKLSTDRQICLLSFAVFPENQEVNRTMLMYWWIGEGILPDTIKPEESNHPDEVKLKKGSLPNKGKPEKDRPEDVVKAILEDFTEKNLIEQVENKRKVEPNSYKMTPFVHSSVVLISKEIGLFDMYHKGQKPRMNKSDLKKVCLVEGSSNQLEAKAKRIAPADIETVFNVSERYPDFIFRWFSTMKVLKVLYLGRWERTEREIEVDSHGLMKDLSSMKKLRFLSFQGISTIISISPSACKLPELIVLDLRGCYNLEQLPEDIHNLKNLVYLDLTGCDALENIPLGLSSLSNMEVLKGFVVADAREMMACELRQLNRLPKLRKLSVRVDRNYFGLDELIEDIKGFSVLEKLKVQWESLKPVVIKKRNVEPRRAEITKSSKSKSLKLDRKNYPSGSSMRNDENSRAPTSEYGEVRFQERQPLKLNGQNYPSSGSTGNNEISRAPTFESGEVTTFQEPKHVNLDSKNSFSADSRGNNEISRAPTFKNGEVVRFQEPQPLKLTFESGEEMSFQEPQPLKLNGQNHPSGGSMGNFLERVGRVRSRYYKDGSSQNHPTGGMGNFLKKLSEGKYVSQGPSPPSTLRKLDLQRFPDNRLPVWLQPQNLIHLDKLYLGSSRHLREFSDSLPEEPSKCNIKVLRLTCLQKLKIDWMELRELYFPKLSFLEAYECPRVTFCPCDQDGIWRAE